MGSKDFPDMYAQVQGRGHTYQVNPDCTCYILYYVTLLAHYKSPKLTFHCTAS